MIVDGHFHIWRQADLPWLQGPMQPRIFGPYSPIMRDYPVEEYLADAAASGVGKSVYVQANWPPDRFEDEVQWVDSVAGRCGAPDAIVAYADFLAEDVRPQLDRLARYSRVRGVRMQLHWHAVPEYRFAATPDVMADDHFRRNIERLADYRLPFELQLFSSQMEDGAKLVADNPSVPFIIVHGGMLEGADKLAFARWRNGMALLAACPNAHVKLSGLGTFVRRLDPSLIATVARELIRLFGSERCMFGSNFPIETLWTDFAALLAAHRAAVPAEAADDIFCNTATRLYRL